MDSIMLLIIYRGDLPFKKIHAKFICPRRFGAMPHIAEELCEFYAGADKNTPNI
jgi:hypothetical protein